MAIKISKAFRDISLTFLKNPVTNDILAINNEDAIKKAVMNLVRTALGERFFNPYLGSDVSKQLFELSSPEIAISLQSEIETLLSNYEPRIRVTTVTVDAPPDTNELDVSIQYDIVGIPLPPQNIQFLLQPTRI